VTGSVRTWLARRTDRERRLVVVAAATTLVAFAASVGLWLRDDLASLAARVEAHERELAQVRRLAATVAAAGVGTTDDGSLPGRVQAAADAAGLADRVAAMTPQAGPDAAGLAVRVSGASLDETVHLLHVLDHDGAPLAIARLGLRKHPDDPRRFDVTLEVAGGRAR
jgi:hypothetical protein